MRNLWIVEKMVEELGERAWTQSEIFTSEKNAYEAFEKMVKEIKEIVIGEESIIEERKEHNSYDLSVNEENYYSINIFTKEIEEEPKEVKHNKKYLSNEYVIDMIGAANQLMDSEEKNKFIEFLEDMGIEVRICSECGCLMAEGYVIEDGYDYYCEEECLIKGYGENPHEKAEEEGIDLYWTEWN